MMSNLYYCPEVHGLKVVFSQNVADCYAFDMFVVWSNGKQLAYAYDSG